jgi:hypothetical protein
MCNVYRMCSKLEPQFLIGTSTHKHILIIPCLSHTSPSCLTIIRISYHTLLPIRILTTPHPLIFRSLYFIQPHPDQHFYIQHDTKHFPAYISCTTDWIFTVCHPTLHPPHTISIHNHYHYDTNPYHYTHTHRRPLKISPRSYFMHIPLGWHFTTKGTNFDSIVFHIHHIILYHILLFNYILYTCVYILLVTWYPPYYVSIKIYHIVF